MVRGLSGESLSRFPVGANTLGALTGAAVGSPVRMHGGPDGVPRARDSAVMNAKALAAFLVGLCLEYWGEGADEQSGLARPHILSMIDTRVGLGTFMPIMEGLERTFLPGG
jgi:hypothetical protein